MGFEETNKTSNATNAKNLFFEKSEIIKSNKIIPNGEIKKGKIFVNISIYQSLTVINQTIIVITLV